MVVPFLLPAFLRNNTCLLIINLFEYHQLPGSLIALQRIAPVCGGNIQACFTWAFLGFSHSTVSLTHRSQKQLSDPGKILRLWTCYSGLVTCQLGRRLSGGFGLLTFFSSFCFTHLSSKNNSSFYSRASYENEKSQARKEFVAAYGKL